MENDQAYEGVLDVTYSEEVEGAALRMGYKPGTIILTAPGPGVDLRARGRPRGVVLVKFCRECGRPGKSYGGVCLDCHAQRRSIRMEELYYNAALKERARALLMEAVEVVREEERERFINRDKKNKRVEQLPTSPNNGKNTSSRVTICGENIEVLP